MFERLKDLIKECEDALHNKEDMSIEYMIGLRNLTQEILWKFEDTLEYNAPKEDIRVFYDHIRDLFYIIDKHIRRYRSKIRINK